MALMAMMAAFGQALPGMPPLPAFDPEASNTRCADYDTKGICTAGSLCPYQHGLDYETVGPQQGSARHHNSRQGRGRAPFSLPGPTRDRTNTSLVIEQIPDENFSEDDVRDFFGRFGTLLDVRLQPYKRLAIVKYDTHAAAAAAYNSPKVIFDNRFVKVYWHRSEHDNPSAGASEEGGGGYGDTDAEMLDPEEIARRQEEIARRQEEAQRAFLERKRKAEEADARAAELDARLNETNAEILRVKRELARVASGDAEEEFSQDLASLQAEAENLFAQQDAAADANSSWADRGRGAYRGGYRGRGGYVPRARGGRGAFRGRGGAVSTRVKRLDNRPRRIAIKDVVPGSERDEALRQHLFVRSPVPFTKLLIGKREIANSFV
jgi:hypothetical protein